MGVYSPARRRLIIALLLTSVLLLAIDVQGNSVIDRGREGFRVVLDPLQSAAEVVSRPVGNAWRGVTGYDDLVDENERLRDLVEGQRADQITARAAQQQYQDLLELNRLPSLSDYPTITAQVVGQSPTNLDQVIEINRGSNDGVAVGMAVVSTGGLVGKVTAPVLSDRSFVMLTTDTRYAVEATVLGVAPPPEEDVSAPSGPSNAIPNDSITTTSTTTTAPPTTLPPAVTADPTPDSSLPLETPGSSVATPSSTPESTTTTTTTAPPIARETGLVEGQGRGADPELRLVDEALNVGRFRRGDSVMTAGGNESLAPPGIPIGLVGAVIRRAGSAGPILKVELSADLDRLNFVRVVIYRPQAEVAPEEVSE
jgi:rod shape-determining protein MreC